MGSSLSKLCELKDAEEGFAEADKLLWSRYSLLTTKDKIVENTMLCRDRKLQYKPLRYKTFQNVVVGSELVDWLIIAQKLPSRPAAVAFGQELFNCGLRGCLNNEQFADTYKSHYHFVPAFMVSGAGAGVAEDNIADRRFFDSTVEVNDVQSSLNSEFTSLNP